MSCRDLHLRVRCTPQEREAFHARAEAEGFTLSEWIRNQCLAERATVATLALVESRRQIARELSRIGNNLNQLARASNAGSNAYGRDLAAIADEIRALREMQS